MHEKKIHDVRKATIKKDAMNECENFCMKN